jgi:hypothetical protein
VGYNMPPAMPAEMQKLQGKALPFQEAGRRSYFPVHIFPKRTL